MRNNPVSTSLPRELYIELINDHIERYGDGIGSHTLDLTSYHEAGHILLAHILGCKPGPTKIWSETAHVWCGYTWYKSQDELHAINSPEKFIIEIMICCAGWLAEGVLGNLIDEGSSIDEKIRVTELSCSLAKYNEWNPEVIVFLCTYSVSNLLTQYRSECLKLAENIRIRKKVKRQEINFLFDKIPVDLSKKQAIFLIKKIKEGPWGTI